MTKEEGLKLILEKYPNISFKNTYFLDQKSFDEFSIDIIAQKLTQIPKNEAHKLSEKLEVYSIELNIKQMIKYLIEENIEYFLTNKDNIYDDINIIKEYTNIYSKSTFTLEDLKNIERKNLENNREKNYIFYNFDINYYNELIIVQKLYKEGKIKQNDIAEFIKFTFELLKINTINDKGNYDIKYDEYINKIISHLIYGNITPSNLHSSMSSGNKISNLLIISKFGIPIRKISSAPIEVISAIKEKQIKNNYLEFLHTENLKEVKNSYTKEELMTIIINMNLLLGSDNVTNIIRHIPQEDEKVKRLFDSFKDMDLSKVQVENNRIIHNTAFINFFIGSNLKEPNSLLNLIYEGKTKISDKIETLYAYWDILNSRYKSQQLKTRLAFFEECFDTSRVVLNQDEYKLEGKIINSYYDNRKFQSLENLTIIEDLRKEYSKMKHTYQKTIPYVSGEYEEYHYETILSNDPSIFVMGSVTDNCFKIGGDADKFVKYCANNVNGRVLSIKDKKGNIVAMVPMIRNGNLILCNSIESDNINDYSFMKKMSEILELVSAKMINISEKSEPEKEKIKIVLLGGYKNKSFLFDRYKAIRHDEINEEALKPLGEYMYTNMGGYDNSNYIISTIENLNLQSLNSFYPNARYNDPRKEVFEIEKEFINDQVKKIVNSIYFEKQRKILDFSNVEVVVFNDDWFILIDNKYNVTSCIVTDDPRGISEYKEYLYLISEYVSHYDIDGHIKEEAKYNYKK